MIKLSVIYFNSGGFFVIVLRLNFNYMFSNCCRYVVGNMVLDFIKLFFVRYV